MWLSDVSIRLLRALNLTFRSISSWLDVGACKSGADATTGALRHLAPLRVTYAVFPTTIQRFPQDNNHTRLGD